MPIDRPIAGSTEIKPVFPMAVAIETQKMITKGPPGQAACLARRTFHAEGLSGLAGDRKWRGPLTAH